MEIKIRVKKEPSKKMEVYDRVLKGEDRDDFTKKIAEAMIKGGRGEDHEREELFRTDGIQSEELPESN